MVAPKVVIMTTYGGIMTTLSSQCPKFSQIFNSRLVQEDSFVFISKIVDLSAIISYSASVITSWSHKTSGRIISKYIESLQVNTLIVVTSL